MDQCHLLLRYFPPRPPACGPAVKMRAAASGGQPHLGWMGEVVFWQPCTCRACLQVVALFTCSAFRSVWEAVRAAAYTTTTPNPTRTHKALAVLLPNSFLVPPITTAGVEVNPTPRLLALPTILLTPVSPPAV